MKTNLLSNYTRYFLVTCALISVSNSFLCAMERKQQEQRVTLPPEEIMRQKDLYRLNDYRKELIARIEELDGALVEDQGLPLILKLEKAHIENVMRCKLLPVLSRRNPMIPAVSILGPVVPAIQPYVIQPFMQTSQQQMFDMPDYDDSDDDDDDKTETYQEEPEAITPTEPDSEKEPQAAASSQTETQTSTQPPTQQEASVKQEEKTVEPAPAATTTTQQQETYQELIECLIKISQQETLPIPQQQELKPEQQTTEKPGSQKTELLNPAAKPYSTPDGRSYAKVAGTPIPRSTQKPQQQAPGKLSVQIAQKKQPTPKTPATKKSQQMHPTQPHQLLPKAHATPIELKPQVQSEPAARKTEVTPPVQPEPARKTKVKPPVKPEPTRKTKAKHPVQPKPAPSETKVIKSKQEPKAVPTPAAASAQEQDQQGKKICDTSSDKKDDEKAAASQPQQAKPTQNINPLTLWQKGVELLQQEETFYQAIDLLEQAFPLTRKGMKLRIEKKALAPVMERLTSHQDNMVVQMLIIRMGIVLGLEIKDIAQRFVKDLTDIFDADQQKDWPSDVPQNKISTTLFMYGYMILHGIQTEQSEKDAVFYLYAALNNDTTPPYICNEIIDILKTMAFEVVQECDETFLSGKSYDLSNPEHTFEGIVACYRLVPILIARNEVLNAAIFYMTAEQIRVTYGKLDTKLFERNGKITEAQKALESFIRKKKGQSIREADIVYALAALQYSQSIRYINGMGEKSFEQILRANMLLFKIANNFIHQHLQLDDPALLMFAKIYETFALFALPEMEKSQSFCIACYQTAQKLYPKTYLFQFSQGTISLAIPPFNRNFLRTGITMLKNIVMSPMMSGGNQSSFRMDALHILAAFYLNAFNSKSPCVQQFYSPQRAIKYLQIAAAEKDPETLRLLAQLHQRQIPTAPALMISQGSSSNQAPTGIAEEQLVTKFRPDDDTVERDRFILTLLEELKSLNQYELLAQYLLEYVKTYRPLDKETREKLIPILTALEKFHKEQSNRVNDMTEENKTKHTKMGICIGFIKIILQQQQ